MVLISSPENGREPAFAQPTQEQVDAILSMFGFDEGESESDGESSSSSRASTPPRRPGVFSPPPKDSPKPQANSLERVPTEILSSPIERLEPLQPTPEMLMERYGIKVRDFAYESVLPPVPVVSKHHPRSTSPKETGKSPSPEGTGLSASPQSQSWSELNHPRALKRARDFETDAERDAWLQRIAQRREELGLTYKAVENSQESSQSQLQPQFSQGISRTGAHFDIEQWSQDREALPQSQSNIAPQWQPNRRSSPRMRTPPYSTFGRHRAPPPAPAGSPRRHFSPGHIYNATRCSTSPSPSPARRILAGTFLPRTQSQSQSQSIPSQLTSQPPLVHDDQSQESEPHIRTPLQSRECSLDYVDIGNDGMNVDDGLRLQESQQQQSLPHGDVDVDMHLDGASSPEESQQQSQLQPSDLANNASALQVQRSRFGFSSSLVTPTPFTHSTTHAATSPARTPPRRSTRLMGTVTHGSPFGRSNRELGETSHAQSRINAIETLSGDSAPERSSDTPGPSQLQTEANVGSCEPEVVLRSGLKRNDSTMSMSSEDYVIIDSERSECAEEPASSNESASAEATASVLPGARTTRNSSPRHARTTGIFPHIHSTSKPPNHASASPPTLRRMPSATSASCQYRSKHKQDRPISSLSSPRKAMAAATAVADAKKKAVKTRRGSKASASAPLRRSARVKVNVVR